MPEGPSASGAAKPRSNLAMRLLSAFLIGPLLLVVLFLGPEWGFQIIVGLTVLAASLELSAMTLREHRLARAWHCVAALVVAAAVLYGRHGDHGSELLLSVLFGVSVAGLLVALGSPEPVDAAAARGAWLIAGPLYVGCLIGAIGLLRQLESGGSWVLLSFMIAWLGDTFAYFAGRAFGRHKLYEIVSPKKTREGALGGLVGSVVGALLAHFWFLPELSLAGGVVLAIVAGAVGQAGDLVESLIKRSTGVKDSGWILPGHGGVLDRADALMFVAPLVWIYATWVAPLL